MKTIPQINYLLALIIISICTTFHANSQMMTIQKVPDFQQPIDNWWGNNPFNTCAPVSAANICVYWDDSLHHSNAMGLNSNTIPDSIPSYLAYFMGTNGEGDTTRANPMIFGTTPGTIMMDIDTGFQEYVRWDSNNTFLMPKPFSLPASKEGFDWKIEKDEVMGFHKHMEEVDARRPDIVVFKYWNIDSAGFALKDEMDPDSIHFFLWDTAVIHSTPPHIPEEWYYDEKTNSVGHAVTGMGYLFGMDPDDAGPLPFGDWIICHDNWSTTPKNVAIPWVDSIWIATFIVDPGPDTLVPYISCMDTTVYLNSSGQSYFNETYVVDSAWDNNGVEQLILNEYYAQCHNTATPKEIIASAIDMFGNIAQCTAYVTVIDTTPPEVACKNTTVYLDETGNVTIDSSDVDMGSTDNCDIKSIEISQSIFDCTDIGSNSVNIIVTDVHSNKDSCIALVTVLDTIRPIVNCIDTTVYLDATGNVTIDSNYIDGGITDNCEISTISLSQSSFNCTDVGINNIDVIVTDVNSNTTLCQSIITVVDTISPVASCMDTTIYLDATGNITMDSSYVNGGSTDNCEILTINLSKSSFDCNDIGSNNITVTVNDESSNSSKCIAEVIVADTISPTITCADTTVYLDASGNYTIDSTYLITDINDNCGIDSTSLSKNIFTRNDVGTPQVIDVLAFDLFGNQNQCTGTVTVLDTFTINVNSRTVDNINNLYVRSIPKENTILINYSLIEKSNLYLAIYTIQGTLIDIVKNEMQSQGSYEIAWQPDVQLPGGIYLCRMKTSYSDQMKKFVYIK